MKMETQRERKAFLLGCAIGVALVIMIRIFIFMIFEADGQNAEIRHEPVVTQHFEIVVIDWRVAQ